MPVSWRHQLLLLGILLLGGAARCYPAATHVWPLGDGGLFLAMARACGQHWLPATVSYNGSLPFCYPPLGFMAAAALARLGVPLEVYFRWGPALWSTACIYALWRLARVALGNEPAALAAACTFALWKWAFAFTIVGGGVARAPALFFAFLGLEGALNLCRERGWNGTLASTESEAATPGSRSRSGWAVAIFLALTLATHLEAAHFAVVSFVAIWAVLGRNRRTALGLVGCIAGALLLTLPWWGTCLARFGAEPFLNAWHSGSGGWPGSVRWQPWKYAGDPSGMPVLTIAWVLALGVALKRRQWLSPLWVVAVVLAEPRSTRELVAVPICLLIGSLAAPIGSRVREFKSVATKWLAPVRDVGLGSVWVWAAVLCAFFGAHLRSLSPSGLEAIAKLQSQPRASRVLVLPGGNDWEGDSTAEWLPALAPVRSISTVQGTEWLGKGAFAKGWQAHKKLEKCKSMAQIEAWAATRHQGFDLIVLPFDAAADKAGWSRLKAIGQELAFDPHYRPFYENVATAIYAGAGEAPLSRRSAMVPRSEKARAKEHSMMPPPATKGVPPETN